MNKDFKGFLEYAETRYSELCSVNIVGQNVRDIRIEKSKFVKWPDVPITGSKDLA